MAVLRGIVTTATRRGAFERVYDLSERVCPPEIRALPTPPPRKRNASCCACRPALSGVATEFDLRDYFRLPVADTKVRLAELVEDGDLVPVEVEGWNRPAYLDPAVRQPRGSRRAPCSHRSIRSSGSATARRGSSVSSMHRDLHTVAKRKHGYYVLPFLLDDRLVGRIDLKADRARSKLMVRRRISKPASQRATWQPRCSMS